MAPLLPCSASDNDVEPSLSNSFVPPSRQTSTEIVSKIIGHDSLECVSSALCVNPQTSMFRQHSSICDIGATSTAELRLVNGAGSHDQAGDPDESVEVDTDNLLHVRDDFTLQGVVSSFEELSQWQTSGKPTDVHHVHNALIMRACCHDNQNYWPCLLDPDNEAEMWVRALRASPLRQRYPIVRVPPNYTGAPTSEFIKSLISQKTDSFVFNVRFSFP